MSDIPNAIGCLSAEFITSDMGLAIFRHR